MCRHGVDADQNVAKVRVAGSNPVVRSKEVQISGLSGPLIRVPAQVRCSPQRYGVKYDAYSPYGTKPVWVASIARATGSGIGAQ